MFASLIKVVLQLEASRKRTSRLLPTLVAGTESRLRTTSRTKEPALSESDREESLPHPWEPCFLAVTLKTEVNSLDSGTVSLPASYDTVRSTCEPGFSFVCDNGTS